MSSQTPHKFRSAITVLNWLARPMNDGADSSIQCFHVSRFVNQYTAYKEAQILEKPAASQPLSPNFKTRSID
jgi:hypothetical protein